MTDYRTRDAAIHRQLAIVWAAGFTAAQLRPSRTAIEAELRVVARQRVIDDAARKIIEAERKGGGSGR